MTHPEHKKQILLIHGGNSFSSYEKYLADLKASTVEYDRLKPSRRWRDTIIDAFPDADILAPTMPNSANAQFDEWAIYFEKIMPHLAQDACIVGHSLGAMFLAKYLHHTPLPLPARQLMLIAGGYNSGAEDYGSFALTSATGLERSARDIHLFHSQDDFVVPYSELDKFHADLPTATVHRFTDRNHFLDPEFPELIEVLQQK